jgi:hypothetical protein
MDNSIKINVYLKDKTNLVENFEVSIGERITSIDSARLIVIKYLDSIYSDVKYTTNIFTTFEGKSEINLIFEDAICLTREFKLRKLLN